MILDRLASRSRSGRLAARRLYEGAVAQSRSTKLYAEMGVADSPEGRFEALTLHVALLVARLRNGGREAEGLRQLVFDIYVSDLDAALREMGVGDLAVGKRMRKLGEAFYGRAKALDEALAASGEGPLLQSISRTLLENRPTDPTPMAAYIRRAQDDLAAQPMEAFLAGVILWPAA